MKQILFAAVVTGIFAAALPAPALGAPPDNWGQEVKACNSTSCYPNGTSRGGYVRVQAKDDQGPGYAWEIHHLAHPGNSSPSLR